MLEKRSPLTVLVLSVITCGIYYLFWLYKTSEQLQYASKEPGTTSPGLELLLCILCAPYQIYWFYKYGKMIYGIHIDKGVNPPDDNSILYLILCILALPIVNVAIMQSSMNRI